MSSPVERAEDGVRGPALARVGVAFLALPKARGAFASSVVSELLPAFQRVWSHCAAWKASVTCCSARGSSPSKRSRNCCRFSCVRNLPQSSEVSCALIHRRPSSSCCSDSSRARRCPRSHKSVVKAEKTSRFTHASRAACARRFASATSSTQMRRRCPRTLICESMCWSSNSRGSTSIAARRRSASPSFGAGPTCE